MTDRDVLIAAQAIVTEARHPDWPEYRTLKTLIDDLEAARGTDPMAGIPGGPPRYFAEQSALAAAPVAEGLDAAWAAAEAALPEGWRLHLLEATSQDEWRVVAGKRIDDGTDPFVAIAEGPTPIAALLALAAKLREADR